MAYLPYTYPYPTFKSGPVEQNDLVFYLYPDSMYDGSVGQVWAINTDRTTAYVHWDTGRIECVPYEGLRHVPTKTITVTDHDRIHKIRRKWANANA